MGSKLSKKKESKSSSNVLNSAASYESAVQHDHSLRSFDTILRDRTTLAIESVLNSPSLSLDSLSHVTGTLVDINDQVVQLILQSKEDIWQNPGLRDLVNEYFSTSSQVLVFYSALEKCIKKIRNSHIFIQLAITRFDEEKIESGSGFSKTLRELENFKATGDPFTEEFFTLFRSVYGQQVLMLSKLQTKKEKLDRKLKGLRSYRKVSNVLFAAAFAAVLICSVVAAAIAAPQLVGAVLAASSAPLGAVGKWMSSLWKGYEGRVKKELDLVFQMEINSLTAMTELQNIRMLVENLKVDIETMFFKAGVAVEQDDEVAVSLVIDEIKKNLAMFTQAVDVLGEQSDKYSRDIRKARAVILQTIIRNPSG